MKTTCTRRFQFCAGHRVMGHENKCRNLHGHNYVMLATAEAPDLDNLGRVIDFSRIKKLIGNWIDIWWDHGFIVAEEDKIAQAALETFNDAERMMSPCDVSWGQKIYRLPNNPTAENMAAHILNEVCPNLFLGTGVTITEIVLWETENCFAKVTL